MFNRCSKGGIGHALALSYQAKGCRVLATSRTRESMSDLVTSVPPPDGTKIQTHVLDVCDEESVKGAFEWVKSVTGGVLDVLVNNAYVSFHHSNY